jgi:radical SAM-linked protein
MSSARPCRTRSDNNRKIAILDSATSPNVDQPAQPAVRTRIRFVKQGDLRFSSHRDLLRVFERLFRRAEVAVRMSEGFHPKPRFMFPSALGLGITGNDEVFDVDLDQRWEPAELIARLAAHSPPGLELRTAEALPDGARKAQAGRFHYELPLPAERLLQTSAAVDRVKAASSLPTARAGREAPVDLRATLEELTICDGVLRMTLRASRTAQARPRDILEILDLADLEFSGGLVRSRVELEPEPLMAGPSIPRAEIHMSKEDT